jgi:hypothetical protein
MPKSKEPCSQEACDIQACLKKRGFIPERYAQMENLTFVKEFLRTSPMKTQTIMETANRMFSKLTSGIFLATAKLFSY